MASIVWIYFVSVLCVACAMPSGIMPCKKSDPDLSSCLPKATETALQAFKSGNKELNMPKIDPLFIKNIHIAGNGGKVDVDQKYTDMNLYGLAGSKVESLKVDIGGGNCALNMVTLTPVVSLVSQYTFVGKLLLFSLNGAGKSNTTLTSGIKPCKKSDPNLSSCLTKAAGTALLFFKSGNKELNMPKIEPLFIKKLHIAGNGGKVDVDQIYNDMNIFGIGSSKFESLSVDIGGGNCIIRAVTFTPVVSLVSQYTFTGKLLLFTINGGGKSNSTMINSRCTHETTCELINKNGAEYASFKEYTIDFVPEKVIFDFENLIKGDEQMSSEVSRVINENNMEIYASIKEDYGRTFSEVFKTVLNTVFENIPHKELLLD